MRFALGFFLASTILQAQIAISGDVTIPQTVTALGKFPQVTVTVTEKDKPVTYTGASLFEILKSAGAPFDEHMQDRALHNRAMISSLLVTAKDGYRVVFSLSELDPKNGNAEVLVISKPDGTFSLLVPHAGSKARNVRAVQEVSVFQPARP